MLLPISNKYTSMNKVPWMHIYVIGKWRLEDLRDLSARKHVLAAGVALRLPPYILPLRWSRKPAYKTLPHHSSDPNKVNMFWISPRILSLHMRRQINCQKVIWEGKKWPQLYQPHWETNKGPSSIWKRTGDGRDMANVPSVCSSVKPKARSVAGTA